MLKISYVLDDVETTLILYLIAKSAISASFLIIFPFAGELYPTQLRGLGIGTSAYIAGLGLIIIPFITYLVRIFIIIFAYEISTETHACLNFRWSPARLYL